jgi:hypothetical protein
MLPQPLFHHPAIIANRLAFLDALPTHQAVEDEHEKRVSHLSTSRCRKPERSGLSVRSIPEKKVSPVFRGANLALSGLSGRPGKSALKLAERVCDPGPSGEELQSDKAPKHSLVQDGKGRAKPDDCGSASPLSRFAPMPWIRAPSDLRLMIILGTRRHGAAYPDASQIECSGKQILFRDRSREGTPTRPDRFASRAVDEPWLRTA